MLRLHRLRRTVAFDLPGHGEARDWTPTPNAKSCAEAVLASLEAMGIARAVLVGHSLGGAVAAIAGLLREEVVERLILIAPGGFGPQMNARLLRRYAQAQEENEIAALLESFFAPHAMIPARFARGLAIQRADAVLRQSHMAIAEAITKGDGQGTLPLSDLAAKPFPISVLWGQEDAVLPVRQALEAPPTMARHILADVGHMVPLEAPDLTARIIAQTVLGRDGAIAPSEGAAD